MAGGEWRRVRWGHGTLESGCCMPRIIICLEGCHGHRAGSWKDLVSFESIRFRLLSTIAAEARGVTRPHIP
jgi:hypothetical protein